MYAIIIFGTRGVKSTQQEGQFHCPQCNSTQHYRHRSVRRFFTLYFIPLIPLDKVGEYVECSTCRNTYITRILEMSPVQTASRAGGGMAGAVGGNTGGPAGGAVGAAGGTGASLAAASSQDVEMDEGLILSEKQKAIKKLLILMILADGKVMDEEIRAFHKVYKETADSVVSDLYAEIDKVKMEQKAPHQYLKEVSPYLNEENKHEILKACYMIAASDGHIDPEEVDLIYKFGRALDLPNEKIKPILKID